MAISLSKKPHTYENLFYDIAVINFFPRERTDQMAKLYLLRLYPLWFPTIHHLVKNRPRGLKFGTLPCSLGKTSQQEPAQTSSVAVIAARRERGGRRRRWQSQGCALLGLFHCSIQSLTMSKCCLRPAQSRRVHRAAAPVESTAQ